MNVRDVMTPNPVTCLPSTSVYEAAELMRDRDIGDVLVQDESGLRGIVTDRDLVVRGLAERLDPASATLEQLCSDDVRSVGPDDSVESVIELMRNAAIRRVPVVEGGHAIGIVAIGDLAARQDNNSVLGDISSSAPNN
jgi:CBS domain-containing protein